MDYAVASQMKVNAVDGLQDCDVKLPRRLVITAVSNMRLLERPDVELMLIGVIVCNSCLTCSLMHDCSQEQGP
jgi:hypothetical protein